MENSLSRKELLQVIVIVVLFDLGIKGLYKMWALKEQSQHNNAALTHAADIVSNLL